MPLPGRGQPALSATVAISRDYFPRDGGLTIHRMSERPDIGFFNFTFDKGAYPSEPVYATTHGIFKAQGDGEKTTSPPPRKTSKPPARPPPWPAPASTTTPASASPIRSTPAQPGRVSISIAWAHHWRWQPLTGDRVAAGLISAAGEFQHGQHWCLLATDGIYRSTDGGKTLEKVLDEKGIAAKSDAGKEPR